MTARNTSGLPEPLVPADVKPMRGMWVDFERLFASELWARATDAEKVAAINLWGRSLQQRPPGSLPNDERALASFAGMDPKQFAKSRAVPMHGFLLCADDRWYHPVVSAQVLRAEAWRARAAHAADAKRNRKGHRDDDHQGRHDDLFDNDHHGRHRDDHQGGLEGELGKGKGNPSTPVLTNGSGGSRAREARPPPLRK